MPNRPRIAIALAAGLVAICAPILASIYLAWHESLAAQRSLSLTYAHDALRRVEEAASQFAIAKGRISQANFPPCSPKDIDLLRQIALGSGYMKAAGHTSGDTLLCTSLGVTTPVSLGKPSLISDRGVNEYFNVKLSPQQWRPLDVFSAGGFAIIADPNLLVDIPTEGSDVEFSVFVPSAPNRDRISLFGGNFQPAWFDPIPVGTQATLVDHGYLVSRVRSAKWDLAVVAAIPRHYVLQRVRHFALFFAPIGVLCGILLAWVVNYIDQLRSSFPAMVRRAIKRKEFYVEYQPIVKLDSRRMIGAEALVRWRSPLGNIPPDQFIPLAEDRGLIHLITAQVLGFITQDLPRILEIDPNFEVAINMSTGDLRSGRTLAQLDQLLHATGALPYNIGIEATERAFLNDPETAKLITTLRNKGFRIAIDDFGTGYSSLACLQSLSLDTLKIDKAFVETIATNGPTSQVVLHIIEMARSLNLQTVAEGVETEEQALFLLRRDVLYAQGWLFGRPAPIASLLRELQLQNTAFAIVDARTSAHA
ncbi:MAG: EAL domain-containing protein [Terracidiphilus sp.]